MHSRKLRPSHLWDVESACSIREASIRSREASASRLRISWRDAASAASSLNLVVRPEISFLLQMQHDLLCRFLGTQFCRCR